MRFRFSVLILILLTFNLIFAIKSSTNDDESYSNTSVDIGYSNSGLSFGNSSSWNGIRFNIIDDGNICIT